MKIFMKKLSVVLFAVIILTLSVVPAFAADNLTLNGVKGIKKGDIVSYDLMLGDCEEDVVGLQMVITFDRDHLDIVNNSLEFPELPTAVSNDMSDHGIIFTYTDVVNPADFSTEKVLASVDFKVLKGGKSDITFFVTELYGQDMTYLKSYTFTYDLAVNDEIKIDGEPPVINNDKDFIDYNQGAFVNYVNGKGEKNGGEADKHESIVGETQAPETFQVGQEVTKDTQNSGSFDLTTIIVIIGAVLLVLIIVMLVILKKVFDRKPEETEKVDVDTDKK